MTAAVRVQRLVQRATQRGRDRVSIPIELITEVLVEQEADRLTCEAIDRLTATLRRRHPGLIPAE